MISIARENDAFNFYEQARKMMSKAGFNLRFWNSNSVKVRQQAVSQNVSDTATDTNVFGMRWNSHTDYLFYPHKEEITTKGKY